MNKKKKSPPTDNEIVELVKELLDGADLEQITMKSVCKQVRRIPLSDESTFEKLLTFRLNCCRIGHHFGRLELLKFVGDKNY